MRREGGQQLQIDVFLVCGGQEQKGVPSAGRHLYQQPKSLPRVQILARQTMLGSGAYQMQSCGQCVDNYYWGVEGWGCKDGSDLYRPIIVKGEETGGQPSQPDNNAQSGDVKAEVWKTRPLREWKYDQKGKEERAKYRSRPGG